MTGAEYIAAFLALHGVERVHCLTGGACAVMIDAIGRQDGIDYICHQHEQSAAMAADAVWRVAGRMGVAMATSGPGATNLITGIACAWYDSIPAFYITGQVNMRESAAYREVRVRQRGFQDTRIVEMVAPVTKYAVQIDHADQLPAELAKAWAIALDGRMGPVLIDVPVNVQFQELSGPPSLALPAAVEVPPPAPVDEARAAVQAFLDGAERPLVLFGAGVGLGGGALALTQWLGRHHLPFVASWNAMAHFDHDSPDYVGGIGVYGNRGANFVLQNADRVLVLGSRLDNRQRTGNTRNFVPGGKVHVVDVDENELAKYAGDGYGTTHLDLGHLPALLEGLSPPPLSAPWLDYVAEMKGRFFGQDISTFARRNNTLSPYQVVQRLNLSVAEDAVVVADTGATLCWLFQMFHRRRHALFTAGGHSPMGYAVPAAIGSALEQPGRKVVAVIGDGGFQLNIQELQTIAHYGLDITIVVFNNNGYGIIRQFQDSYCGSRHEASGRGYSSPDFGKVAQAYGLDHVRVEQLEQITPELFARPGARVIEVVLAENTLIEPKWEVGRPINDQFPYMDDADWHACNRFVAFERYRPQG